MKKIFLILSLFLLMFTNFAYSNPLFMVMDFENADTESRKYQEYTQKNSNDDDSLTLTADETARLSSKDLTDLAKAQIAERMQRRAIEAQKIEQENLENKQRHEDYRSRAVSSALGRELIQGPALLESELMSLGYNIVDRRYAAETISQSNFLALPRQAQQNISKYAEVNQVSYYVKTNVSDYHVEKFSQMVNNIAYKGIVHSLELEIRVTTPQGTSVANARGRMEIDERKLSTGASSNTGLMRQLLKGALADAVASLDMKLKKRPEFRVVNESSANMSSAKPKVYFGPKDSTGKEIDVEIEIDGEYAGNAPSQVTVSEGQHAIKFIRNSVEVWSKSFNLKDGMKISPTIVSK